MSQWGRSQGVQGSISQRFKNVPKLDCGTIIVPKSRNILDFRKDWLYFLKQLWIPNVYKSSVDMNSYCKPVKKILQKTEKFLSLLLLFLTLGVILIGL